MDGVRGSDDSAFELTDGEKAKLGPGASGLWLRDMTDSGGRVCLTCGSRAKLTSAHLVGEALQKLLPASHSGTTFTLSTPGSGVRGDIEWRDYSANSLELQVKRLCEPCNRDWMGTLEGKTRDVIAAMAGGQRVRLDSDMTVAVATWSCLVAMLRSTAQAGPWFFEVEQARDVRERNAAPPGWHVWLLRADERPDFVARQMGAVEESTGVPWLASYFAPGSVGHHRGDR
jgi:hypothetical protein